MIKNDKELMMRIISEIVEESTTDKMNERISDFVNPVQRVLHNIFRQQHSFPFTEVSYKQIWSGDESKKYVVEFWIGSVKVKKFSGRNLNLLANRVRKYTKANIKKPLKRDKTGWDQIDSQLGTLYEGPKGSYIYPPNFKSITKAEIFYLKHNSLTINDYYIKRAVLLKLFIQQQSESGIRTYCPDHPDTEIVTERNSKNRIIAAYCPKCRRGFKVRNYNRYKERR